jgi:hypothetical protein
LKLGGELGQKVSILARSSHDGLLTDQAVSLSDVPSGKDAFPTAWRASDDDRLGYEGVSFGGHVILLQIDLIDMQILEAFGPDVLNSNGRHD